ncbi:hypothetical protein HMPREF3222_00070, partial [Clostridium perfringens]
DILFIMFVSFIKNYFDTRLFLFYYGFTFYKIVVKFWDNYIFKLIVRNSPDSKVGDG